MNVMIINTKFKNTNDVVSIISICWLFIILHLTSSLRAQNVLDREAERLSHSLLVPSYLCTPLKMEDDNLDQVFSPGEPHKTTKPLHHVLLQILTNARQLRQNLSAAARGFLSPFGSSDPPAPPARGWEGAGFH